MSLKDIRLAPLENPDSSMWIDEAIWGHMLYDEQLPWLVYLEFLNVAFSHDRDGHLLAEPHGLNKLRYRACWRLELRNILFNNPKMEEIRLRFSNEDVRWRDWCKTMSRAGGLPQPDFAYLRERFSSFDDFAEVVGLFRLNAIEGETNKRWTSKYVFPYGRDCIYEDLDNNAATNDRHFFRRTGELLYLMLSRSSSVDELRKVLKCRLLYPSSVWNRLAACLQPPRADEKGAERANAFLPYPRHRCYDALASDWLSILALQMPGYDPLPYIIDMTGLHIVLYQLSIAQELCGERTPVRLICEAVAPKKTLVRELSCEVYQSNNHLPAQAITSFLDDVESSEDWQAALQQPEAFSRCRTVLQSKVLWPMRDSDYEGDRDPLPMMAELRESAKRRHLQHVANIHRNYGRAVGLVSRRGTNKLRYAPTDELLKALIFANVTVRQEFAQFLARLFERYGIVFGDREASLALDKGEFELKAFQANARRLEQRLASLGLLKRLSDGCAYVLNPYSRSPS